MSRPKSLFRYFCLVAAEIRARRSRYASEHGLMRASRPGLREDQRPDALPLAAVDHKGEVLRSFATKERDEAAALKFMKKPMSRHCCAQVVTTDRLRLYRAAVKEIGIPDGRRAGATPTTGPRTHTSRSGTPAGNAEVPTNEDATEVCLRPPRLPQPAASPREPRQTKIRRSATILIERTSD